MLLDAAHPAEKAEVEASTLVVEASKEATSSEVRDVRLDIYLFFSFDLVGSTALKSRQTSRSWRWLDVFQYFYAACQRVVEDLGVHGHEVWKYIGDEVLFYLRIQRLNQIEQTVSAVFRSLNAIRSELEDHHEGIADLLSVKAIAWIAPVRSYVGVLPQPQKDRFKAILASDIVDNWMFEGPQRLPDFLGPDIDAGFRLNRFARRLQLVISPALAYYMFSSGHRINDMRIVDMAVLKGVAGDRLLPGVWYNESWDTISEVFAYDERFADPLAKSACERQVAQIDVLVEVRAAMPGMGHFFEKKTIDDIIAAGWTT